MPAATSMGPGLLNRRRFLRVFVRRYQFRFVLANLLFFCVTGGAFVALLFGPLITQLLDPSARIEDQAAVADAFLALHTRIWLLLGLVAFAGTVRLAIVSHRVAGPLLRFTRVLRAIQAGDLSAGVKIRSTDYLQPEAEALNGALATLRRRLRVAQHSTRRLEAALARLGAESSGVHENAALLSAVQEGRRLQRQLGRFRTGPEPPRPLEARTPKGAPVLSAPGKRAARGAGFTLIELLVAVAIVGTLAAIAVPVYSSALDVAKVARAVADVRAMSREIELIKITTGHPPDTLVAAGLAERRDPYGYAYVYLRIDGLKGKGAVRKDRKLNPLNSDFDLYSVGKDGKTQQQVNNKDSLDDIIRAGDGGFVGLARDF